MKKKPFLISIILISSFLSFAQLNWEKHENNPVMPVQYGTWYSWNVFFPVVIHEDGIYKMWFCGNNSSANRHIGYAESPDGIEWEILDDPVISGGEPGLWALHVYPGSVIRINDTLKMWFSGSTNSADNGSIGYAWSVADHVWNINPSPVLEAGVSGAWDSDLVFHPSVYYNGTLYHIYYSGSDNDFETGKIGHAISIDGVNWEKDSINNPVVSLGSSGTFYDTHAISSHTMMFNDTLRMYFTGTDGTSSYPPYYSFWRIGYAWSLDYINWNIDPEPVLDVGNPGAWDESIVAGPSVLIYEGQYKMWYWGDHYNANWEIGYACGDNAIIRVPAQQPTIQAGINAACDGSTVLVDEGTYYENINFMGKAITVASQYIIDGEESHIENTIIDGSQPANPDIGSVVTFDSGEDTTSIIMGFTITGGTGINFPAEQVLAGGGISVAYSGAKIMHNYIEDNHLTATYHGIGAGLSQGPPDLETNIVIRNNVVQNNTIIADLESFGGGISTSSHAIIENNLITNNSSHSNTDRSGAGGLCVGGEEPRHIRMVNNTISYNSAASNTSQIEAVICAGAWIFKSYGIVCDNSFEGNTINTNQSSWGPGVHIGYCGNDLFFERNKVINNKTLTGTGYGGGVCIWQSTATLNHNLISGNTATRGAGIYISNADPELILINHNTIVHDTASTNGGGVYLNEGNAKITNSILWNNDALYNEQIHLLSGSLEVSFSDIQDGYNGNGNIDADPLFEDTENNDFHLLESSPCIDAGDPTYPYDPDNTIVDIGAFYFNHDSIVALEATEITGSSFQANWEEVESAIGYLLDVALDENFTSMVEGYINLDVGNVLSFVVDELTPLTSYFYRIRANYYLGRSGYSNTIIMSTLTSIEDLLMNHNLNLKIIPNPISSTTRLTYLIKQKSPVFLDIYSINGKHIQQILNEVQEEGEYQIVFDASDLPAGVYFCVLKTDEGTYSTKLLKL